jgi:outer membrane receptor protein involved in Fe transport
VFIPTGLAAQVPPAGFTNGVVEGRVLDADGLGVPGIEVRLEGGRLATPLVTISTAPEGRFRFENVPGPAGYILITTPLGTFAEARVPVAVSGEGRGAVDIRLALGFSEEVTVTDTREGRRKSETPASVESVTRATIAEIRPTHPSQVATHMAGVWVNTTGGEGHMTAIRQPLTTNPVYLYLEDGVPTRSTGFFNHNALYETNVPAAEGIEVTKGPGSALYGSDAIGGVINVLTRPAMGPTGLSVDTEGGGHGWRRLLTGGNISSGTNGFRGDLNLTHSDGWRDATGYDRQGGTFRWDMARPNTFLKTMVSFSHIDQQTAGSSALSEPVYLTEPETNLTPISYRKVSALRISTDYQHTSGSTLWSAIPYFRFDTMGLLPNWTLTFDPTEYDTRNTSYGVLAKVRKDFTPMRTQVVAGFDLDLSPGGRIENQIVTTSTVTPVGRIFESYTPGPVIYDYDVTFLALAPYAQVDFSPAPRLRASIGARFDRMSYDYTDNLDAPINPRYLRPEDTTVDYTHLSPKLGLTYQVTSAVSVFGAYRNAFRAPSEGQLFRQGSTRDTINLKPVKADNLETGVRVRLARNASVEASVYHLEKHDDILNYRDPVDGLTHVVNAGETQHVGVEIAGQATPLRWLAASANYAYAEHTYVDWVLDPRQVAGVDYTGNEMEAAPRHMGNVFLSFFPQGRARGSVEVNYIGSYWMDAANTQKYDGHTLTNLRGEFVLTRGVTIFGRVLNVTDERYAETSSYTIQRGREFAPGMPRTAYLGVTVGWNR